MIAGAHHLTPTLLAPVLFALTSTLVAANTSGLTRLRLSGNVVGRRNASEMIAVTALLDLLAVCPMMRRERGLR